MTSSIIDFSLLLFGAVYIFRHKWYDPSAIMRIVRSLRNAFYVVLMTLFLFCLHHNGAFDAVGQLFIPSDILDPDTEAVLRNSLDFRLSNGEYHQVGCEAKNNVVFLKTHKTASSTAAAIIERYGFNRNLTFAVNNMALKFSHSSLFTRAFVKESSHAVIGWKKEDGYNMLTNHARFNKPEMDAVVHNATYVTIIRNPVDQLESAFGYFNLGSMFRFTNDHQLDNFMKYPERYFGTVRKGYWQFAKNNQLFDLGLDHVFQDDPDIVTKTIHKLDRDFELVMVSEYFDESLLLMRRLLCWEFDDILYISKAIRSASHRLNMSDDLRQRIQDWNNADMQLYRHFNASLWRKIKEYGPAFRRDLDHFRTRLKSVSDECIDQSRKNTKDKREDKFVLLKDAPSYCRELIWGDVEYTRFIQQMMLKKGILLPSPQISPKNV